MTTTQAIFAAKLLKRYTLRGVILPVRGFSQSVGGVSEL